jgi:DNA polymerase I
MSVMTLVPSGPLWQDVVFDVESDGLLDQLTVMHCLVLRDIPTNAVMSCSDDPRWLAAGNPSIAQGLDVLSKAKRVYAHNGVSFDAPAITKLYPAFRFSGKLRDTFLVASLRWAHVKESDYQLSRRGSFPARLAGSHMLEAWGHRLGCPKGEYTKWCEENGLEPWAEWRPEMQTYCEADTDTTRRLVLHIRKMGGISEQSVEIEHKLRAYLSAQERNGWPFDIDKAHALVARLSARREVLGQQLIAAFGSWYVQDGKVPFVPKRSNKKLGVEEGCPYTKLKLVEFNPTSRQHICGRLQTLYGWKPATFTDNGQPELNDDIIKLLPYAEAPLLAEYLLVSKRLGQISEGKQAWLNHETKDGYQGGKMTLLSHIHGRVKQNAAVTHRATHSSPNIAQTPKVGVPYGAECRELFTVPKGWVLVGSDASGLELRCLAHYMARYDDGAYIKTILEGKNEDGTDVHSVNRDALGLPVVLPDGQKGRDLAKTFIYAFLYGSGDLNLGQLIGVSAEEIAAYQLDVKLWKKTVERLRKRDNATDPHTVACAIKGATLKARFLKNTPALKLLIAAVAEAAVTTGYLTMPDGRRTYIRHKHAALNSLLQSAGAVICKAWIVEFDRRLTEEFGPQGWDGQWAALGWIHDEVQIACRPEIAPRVEQILIDSIRSITELFAWRCPLDGAATTGGNWKETH